MAYVDPGVQALQAQGGSLTAPVALGGPQQPALTSPVAVGAGTNQAPKDSTKSDKASHDKAAAQQIESIKQQVDQLLTGLTGQQMWDPTQQHKTAQQVAALLQQLPYADANKILSSNPMLKGTALGTAVTAAASQPGGAAAKPAAAKPAAPFYDPLALQTMWHDVFGPAYAQASKIGASAAPSYQAAMNQALAGAHQSPQATQQMKAGTDATTALLAQFAGNQAQSVPAGLSFDSMINALGQAQAKAQLAQGAYERQASYQGAAPFLGGTSSTGGTTPGGAAALLAPIIAGTPGAATGGSSPLLPNIP